MLIASRSMAAFGVLTGVLMVTSAPRMSAQETPTVFVHGGASTGATWTVVSDSLRSALLINPQRPTLGRVALPGGLTTGGYAGLQAQASELAASLSLSGSYAAVAHSAGGLTVRELAFDTRQAGGQQRINRLITVGTPHRGLPLVRRMSIDNTQPDVRTVDESFRILYSLIPWYNVQGTDMGPFFRQGLQPTVDLVLQAVLGNYRSARWWVPKFAPITADLHPTASTRLPYLNGQVGTTEAFMDRWAVVGQTTNEALLFKAVFPLLWNESTAPFVRARVAEYEGHRRTLTQAFIGAALAYSVTWVLYYSENGLPTCITGPVNNRMIGECTDEMQPLVYFLGAAWALDHLHPIWRRAIGAAGDNTSDAVVPDSSQRYPGLAPSRQLILSSAYHGLETSETRSLIASVMSQQWGIPPRIPPLENSITRDGSWYTAHPSGGRQPYSYQWDVYTYDCGGGGEPLLRNLPTAPASRAAPGGSVGTDALPCGWQSMENYNYTVYWRYTQSTIRSTVMDADGGSAVAEYYIP